MWGCDCTHLRFGFGCARETLNIMYEASKTTRARLCRDPCAWPGVSKVKLSMTCGTCALWCKMCRHALVLSVVALDRAGYDGD